MLLETGAEGWLVASWCFLFQGWRAGVDCAVPLPTVALSILVSHSVLISVMVMDCLISVMYGQGQWTVFCSCEFVVDLL